MSFLQWIVLDNNKSSTIENTKEIYTMASLALF